MNIYRFELRRQLGGALCAAVVLAGTLLAFFAGVWPIFSDAAEEVERLLAAYPPEFLAAFGFMGDTLSYAGFFTFGYLYLALIAAIVGAAQGVAIFGREKRCHAQEFLLARPVSRAAVFGQKLACALTVVVMVNAPYLIAAGACYEAFGDGAYTLEGALVAASAVTLVHVMFLAFGMLAAVLARRIRSVSGIASCLGLLGFVLAMLPALTDEELFRVVSPFRYFDVTGAFADASFEPAYLVLAAVVTLACMLAAFLLYTRKDA